MGKYMYVLSLAFKYTVLQTLAYTVMQTLHVNFNYFANFTKIVDIEQIKYGFHLILMKIKEVNVFPTC